MGSDVRGPPKLYNQTLTLNQPNSSYSKVSSYLASPFKKNDSFHATCSMLLYWDHLILHDHVKGVVHKVNALYTLHSKYIQS